MLSERKQGQILDLMPASRLISSLNRKARCKDSSDAFADGSHPSEDYGMTDEEFLELAAQAALQTGAGCEVEPVRSEDRIAEAEAITTERTEKQPNGSASWLEGSDSFGDLEMTDEELVEVASHGRLVMQTDGEVKIVPSEGETAQARTMPPKQPAPQPEVPAQAVGVPQPAVREIIHMDTVLPLSLATEGPNHTPGQPPAAPGSDVRRPNMQTPAAEALVLSSFERLVQEEGFSLDDLFLTAKEVAAIRNLASVPVEPAVHTFASDQLDAVQDPQHVPEAGPAAPPLHAIAGDIVQTAQASSHTLCFTSSELADLCTYAALPVRDLPVKSPPSNLQPSPLTYLPSAHTAFIAPANYAADTPTAPSVVGTALENARKAGIEAACVAPSVSARLMRSGDCMEGWVAPYQRRK
ncbi:hypothetical protein MMC18_002444 [Xylographa bjoerkii]|nr:hypothetical protein [Xylographa bjoerkii]